MELFSRNLEKLQAKWDGYSESYERTIDVKVRWSWKRFRNEYYFKMKKLPKTIEQ